MTYRILLVDDDPFFLRVYSDFLRTRGFAVETVNNGELAMAAYQKGRYQLVLVDILMPGITGLELIEHIKSLTPSQDVIVLSGTDEVRTAVKAMKLGVYDYLVKPIEREELLLVINRLQERTQIYQAQARQLYENIEYAELQQLVQAGMDVMNSLELEAVCERLLATLSDVCGAQAATLWLAKEEGGDLAMHGFRGLVEMGSLPMSLEVDKLSMLDDLQAGVPVLATDDLPSPLRQTEPSKALLVPLARDEKLFGMVALSQKLGGGFDSRDASRTKLIGDCGTTAVTHARRYAQLERVGLRDPSTAAYNMTYFVDYLGRELHKARRYRRNFALVEVSLDNLSTLRSSLTGEVYMEMLRRLVLSISSALHDVDVLARVTDDQMFLLLPETDLLGALNFAHSARAAMQSNDYLAEIDREHPIAVSFGPSAFPRDGDDVDQLFTACKRRLQEARRSLFRRLHLEDLDFWGAAELLIGPKDAYATGEVNLPKGLQVTDDKRGQSRHTLFPADLISVMRGEVAAEAARQQRSSGLLFVGGSWPNDPNTRAFLEQLLHSERGAIKTYLLGDPLPDRVGAAAQVTPVRAGNGFSDHEVVLMLAEYSAYGLLARRRQDGDLEGFHTADWTLVEGLIEKLQEHYHLQRGVT